MPNIVVLQQIGIEAGVGRYEYLVQGDPSVLGLKAPVGSLAIQVDSATPLAQFNKLTTADTGWSLVAQSAGAGASSATGSYRASAFSVPVDGSTDATAALNTLTGTTMPQTGGPYALIVGPGETIATASDVTLPATVQIQSTGGTLKPASGKKLIVNAQPQGAGKIFDHSAGGTVMSGRGMVSNPRWWGADPTGVVGATDQFNAAWGFLAADPIPGDGTPTGTWGGKVHFDSGTFLMDQYGLAFGDAYGNVIIEGEGPSTVLQSPAGRVIGVALEWKGTITLYGATAYSAQKVTVRDLRFRGSGASDATTFLLFDQCSEVTLENLYFENNGIESVRSLSGTAVRKFTVHNCHANSVGLGRGAGWMNIGAESFTMTDSTVENSSVGLETGASFTTISNCRFKDMTNWGIMVFSTWSGYLDGSFNQINTYGANITGNQFINIPDRAILLPDFTGHANASYPTHGPAHLDGNKGQTVIANNLFDRCSIGVWGGADLLGVVDCHDNQFMGSFDSGTGPQTPALAPQAGTWNIHHNTFALGKGIQWQGLVTINSVTTGKPDRMTIADNIVINKGWASGSVAVRTYQATTIRGTRFLDLDGTIAAAPTATMYRVCDSADASKFICELKTSEWYWQDPNHQICMGSEPTILPVNGNSLPAQISFKPGDVLVNRGGTAAVGWFNKKCVTGGTYNPTPLTMTATGTIGTNTITVTDTNSIMQYGWIYFPAIPAIAPKRVMTGVASGTITLDSNLEATVTAGTAVSWATPTWITDRDANSLTIASQASGDLLYANSATSFTRLGKGLDGQTLSLASGVPAWISAQPRYDAGNTATALTVTWTDVRQEQKCTLTAATPTVTVAGIPAGGYLVLDVFQDATGSRVATFAQSGMGSLVWANGNVAPTVTPTASVSDRFLFHNDGTRCIGNIIWQNT